jgi:phosphotransferase system  glucose/maltose/N-acetylglucosamine-specific IIC component
MQLKYNRQRGIGSSLGRILIKLVLFLIVTIVAIFLIEKINFPSPEQNYKIDITNEIKKLK